MNRRYSELIKIPTFEERFEYLKLDARVGDITFGFDRYLNQALYKSREWRYIRPRVITRDEGRDMGLEGYEIGGRLIVHHMNPITLEDIEEGNLIVFDPEYLITVSHDTHNAITYGNFDLLPKVPITRLPGDTKLW